MICTFCLTKKYQKVKSNRCFSPLFSKAGNTTNAGKPHLCISNASLNSRQRMARRFDRPTHIIQIICHLPILLKFTLPDFISMRSIKDDSLSTNCCLKRSPGCCPSGAEDGVSSIRQAFFGLFLLLQRVTIEIFNCKLF